MTQIHYFFSLRCRIARGEGSGSRAGGVAVELPGGSVALDAGIGVGVEAGGESCGLGVVDNLDGARRWCVGVVAQGDGFADEHGVDLVEPSVEADGAVFHHAAFGLEEEEVVEVEVGVGVAHVVPGERPLVERGAPVESAMGRLVVLALDPGPQGAVQCVEAGGGLGGEVGEPGGAKGAEEAFDFSLPRGLIGAGVDERDAELGAHERELLGAVVGAVVDEQSHGESPACDGLLEHGQERGGVLRVREGGEGEDAGGIVDKRDEEALSAPAPVADLRPVHHIAHPQLAGVAEGEASPVGGGGVAGVFVEQALAREQAVHGGGGERVVDAALAGRRR